MARILPFVTILWCISPLGYAADQPTYQPCPLLRAYYPELALSKSSDAVKALSDDFTVVFDDLVHKGKSDDFGIVTPNTTSFSVVLFSKADGGTGDPILYSYHHTASTAGTSASVTSDTVFALGSLTQLFTIYTWLTQLGPETWEDPITKFLPELVDDSASTSEFTVDWNGVTVGALAGHMAGIARDSNVCQLGAPCDRATFRDVFSSVPPVFLPDTTPIFSHAAFQILAFALTARSNGKATFNDFLRTAILQPLNMTRSGLLDKTNSASIFGAGLNASAPGEQAALSLLSSPHDLALAGQAILSSRLLPPATTRRWLSPISADTSNIRNGVGRPWELYRAPFLPNSSQLVVNVLLKSGDVGPYSSYLGLVPDIGVGFAILAHDAGGRGAADLNVYADIVAARGLGSLMRLAAKEAAVQYGGVYIGAGMDGAVFTIADDGPGLVVRKLTVGGIDAMAEAAAAAGIPVENLDFRAYPTNVFAKGGLQHQFVGVLQDRGAPVDAGTPTCITWMTVGGSGSSVISRFVFELDSKKGASKVFIPGKGVFFGKSK